MAKNSRDPDDRRLRTALAFAVLVWKSKRGFQHFPHRNVRSVSKPRADGLLPDIVLKAGSLLGRSKRFQLGRFEVPWLACSEASHRLGPQLIAVTLKASAIDGTDARDRPESSCASRVLQVATDRWVDGGGEDALTWQVDAVSAKGRAKPVVAPRDECFLRGR